MRTGRVKFYLCRIFLRGEGNNIGFGDSWSFFAYGRMSEYFGNTIFTKHHVSEREDSYFAANEVAVLR